MREMFLMLPQLCFESVDQFTIVIGDDVLEVIYAAYASAGEGKKVSLPFASDVKKPVDLWLRN